MRIPAGYLLEERGEFGGSDLPILTVVSDYGVRVRDLEAGGRAVSDDISGYRRVRPGDLVVNRLWARFGAYGVSEFDGLISPAYWVLKPDPARVNGRFLHSLLRSSRYLAEIRRLSKDMPPNGFDLPWDLFKRMLIELPELPAQRAIADYLDTETARIDALIAKKQRMIELSNLRWRRQLLDVVAPHLSGVVTPDDWVQGRLRNLVDRVVGGSWGAEPGEASVDAPCVRAADFNFLSLSAEGGSIRSYGLSEMQSRVVRPGDLVIEKSGGGDEAPVGRVVMWLGEKDGVPTNFAARLRPVEVHDSWFVLLAFRAAYEAGLNWRSIKQTTGIQNLDTGAYLSEPWQIPPIGVQRRIASDLRARLDSALRLREALQRQINLLREHRQALITAAVTGELEVPGVAA